MFTKSYLDGFLTKRLVCERRDIVSCNGTIAELAKLKSQEKTKNRMTRFVFTVLWYTYQVGNMDVFAYM